MSELKMRLEQAFFNPSHPCRGGTTKSLLENSISVPLPVFNLRQKTNQMRFAFGLFVQYIVLIFDVATCFFHNLLSVLEYIFNNRFDCGI